MRATDEEVDKLYEMLSLAGLQARDVIREIRREGKFISSLAELSSFEVIKLTKDCEKYLR